MRIPPGRSRVRRRRAAGLLALAAAVALATQLPVSPASTAFSPPSVSFPTPSLPGPSRDRADSALPDGATVFDGEYPGVAKLDPGLLAALRRAAADAGFDFPITSGWRSPEYQERLLQDAGSEYGSEAEAARWVATPDTSPHVSGGAGDPRAEAGAPLCVPPPDPPPHVSGDAADLGSDAAAWLSDHGAAYGLCQIYGNEPWHFELRSEAVDDGCPPAYADPTDDPRMQ